MTGARKAAFLDRDGVLCRAILRDGRPFPPQAIEEMELLPGAPEACRALQAEGFVLVMVTNQPDVARGTVTLGTVEAINRQLQVRLGLDKVKVCPHDDRDACRCRKPKPGMLVEAAEEIHIDLGVSFMIGDRWRDVEAGRRAGCRTVLIDYHYGEGREGVEPDYRAKSLEEAVAWVLKTARQGEGVRE